MAVRWGPPAQKPVHPFNWIRTNNDFRITQEYDDIDLYWKSQGIVKIHGAVDIGDGDCGSILTAMADSTILWIVDETPPPKGPALGVQGICTEDPDWLYEIWHVSERLVPHGAKVKRGDPIAKVGATGLDIGGCHAHIKMSHRGVWIDPEDYILGKKSGAEIPEMPFKDVPTSYKFYADIKWLKDKGLSNGVGGGLFKPDGLVTRGQQAAMLRRLYSLLKKEG